VTFSSPVFSGTPTASGTFPVTFTASNSAGAVSQSFSLVVSAVTPPPPPSNTVSMTSPFTMPQGTVSVAYSASIATVAAVALNGTPCINCTYAIESGLPAGLTVAPATGIVSGTPSTPGTSSFTVTVTAPSTTGVIAVGGTLGVIGLAIFALRRKSKSMRNTLAVILFLVAGSAFGQSVTGTGTITGTGSFTVVASAPPGTPKCGGVDDHAGHLPSPSWASFVPPASVGGTYVDQLGVALGGTGCTVKRLTVGGDTVHYYSTHEPMNSNDTYIFVAGAGTCGGGGGWCVINLSGTVIVNNANMPSATNPTTVFMWSATNPALFYYTNNNSLMSATITGTNTLSLATVHTFSSSPQYTYITITDETRISLDGSTIALVGEHVAVSGVANVDVFSYNLNSNTITSSWTSTLSNGAGKCSVFANSEYSGSGAAPFPMGATNVANGCIHKIIMSTDNRAEVEWEAVTNSGTQSEPNMDAACKSAFAAGQSCKSLVTSGGTLFNMQTGTTHTDSYQSLTGGLNMFLSLWDPSPNGSQGNDPCPNHGGHSSMNDANNAVACVFTTAFTGGHISTAGTSPSQPWALIAYDDTSRPTSPEWWTTSPNYVAPTNTSCSQYTQAGSSLPGNCFFPYESEDILVNVGSVGNTGGLGGTTGDIYRLFWSRTRDDSSEFWGQQRAALSRDGKYIVFSSNMAYPGGNCSNPSDLACSDVYLVGPLF